MTKPNHKEFLEKLNNAIDSFVDNSRSYNKTIIISHNDADGISSLKLIQNVLYKFHLEHDYFIYNRSSSWSNYLKGILPKVSEKKGALIFTDVGSSLEELVPIIRERKEDFYILDHHEVENYCEFDKIPENLYFVNPTIYGFDGLDHIAGSTLAYMFAKSIDSSIIKYGWLTVIGIAGDSLRSMDMLKSYNKEIYEEIRDEEAIIDREGLILFGSMHESIKNGLKYSILPHVKDLSGESDDKVKEFLTQNKIIPNKKVIELNSSEIEKIVSLTNASKGHYALLPQKQGILSFAFEHALLLNILSFKNISSALSIIQQRNITRYAKEIYYDYIKTLTINLKKISKEIPHFETEKAIFIDAGNGKIPPSNWSDTASFCSVNNLLDPNKMLFLGGLEKKTQMMKLSIRCSKQYLKSNKGVGVNQVISKIKDSLGGMGGGHKLAGGIRLSIPSYNQLKENVENFL
jgi:single-stranded DNA-specific DHH superfamily exonuclease